MYKRQIYGDYGDDIINAGDGNYRIYGDTGHTRNYSDNDWWWNDYGIRAYSQGGNDTIAAGAGNDSIWGGYGDDIINAGDGDNTVYGGDGNDSLTGGSGVDVIEGGEGNDTFQGNGGNDIYYGYTTNSTDSNKSTVDTLVLSGAHSDYAISRVLSLIHI